MKNIFQSLLIPIIPLILLLLAGCKQTTSTSKSTEIEIDPFQFPAEIVDFIPYENNPVLTGSGTDTWDQLIRERGYILRENGIYHMWYTGYREGLDSEKHLGYATSLDGMEWKEQGPLDVRYTNGESLTEGPYGTPTVWLENGVWYLFYERKDLGIWLATSTDLKKWVHLQDDPVIELGPEKYDQQQVALNQIIKYKGNYFAYYHASEYEDWRKPWTSCVAMSEDLIHWKKYSKNPIMRENKSSPILVFDGSDYRLYTMHPEICVHFPRD